MGENPPNNKTFVATHGRRRDPVVDLSGNHSEIYFVEYSSKNHLGEREPNSKLIGYCTENPFDVLKIVFPDFNVIRFSDFYFLHPDEAQADLPLKGLGIDFREPVRGVQGKLEELNSYLDRARRTQPLTQADLQQTIEGLDDYAHHGILLPQFHQTQNTRRKVVDILSQVEV